MLYLHLAFVLVPFGLTHLPTALRDYIPGTGIIKRVLGIECPACGITRSYLSFVRGDMADAIRLHPGGPVVAILALLLAFYFAGAVIWEKRAIRDWKIELVAYRLCGMVLLVALCLGWLAKHLL